MSFRRNIALAMITAGLVAQSGSSLFAQDSKPRDNKNQDGDKRQAEKGHPAKGKADSRKTVNVEMHEAQALGFAREHHAELAGLLESLKNTNQREYNRGIQELFRTSDRLAKLKDKSPELYRTELKTWQLDSQIRLMQARMTMSDDPHLELEIRELLKQRLALRLSRLRDERARAEKTMKQLDQRISETEKSLSEEGLEAEFTRVKRELAASRERKKTKKPGAEKNVGRPVKKAVEKTAERPSPDKTDNDKPKEETSKAGVSEKT